MNKVLKICTTAFFAPTLAFAQAAPEHHIWQDRGSFEPISHTAQAITGYIKLSGNKDFARVGSKMSLTLTTGASVSLKSFGASWRMWDDANKDKVTAEIFGADHDPGKLVQGNTFCGNPTNAGKRLFFVFYEDSDSNLGVDVFQSEALPQNIDSPGLCGTFRYAPSAKGDKTRPNRRM